MSTDAERPPWKTPEGRAAKMTDIDEVRILLDEYEQFLSGKAKGTVRAYLRTVRHLIEWMAQLPESSGQFQPQQLTQTTVERYLTHLEQAELSIPYRVRVKSTISSFARFLIEEKRLLRRNPTRGIKLPVVPLPSREPLSHEQRRVLRSLVKQERDQRGSALFSLGYWAGCKVSEIAWLRMADTHVGREQGWLHIGGKRSKGRDIVLMDQARQPLYAYLQTTRDMHRTYVFMSQHSERLRAEAIYYWFRTLKAKATKDQAGLIAHLTFNDLRYDFAHRARDAGWSSEEVAYYLGGGTRSGAPALQTIRGPQEVSRERMQEKLKYIQG